MTADQTVSLGLKRQQAGQFAEAEGLYRQALEEKSDHPDALHLLGVLAYQHARYGEAVELINRAIRINPRSADYYCNLGLALAGLERFDESAAAYRRSLELDPLGYETHYNLGNTLRDWGKPEEAVAAYRHAISLRPQHVKSLNNLGSVLRTMGRLDESVTAYRQAISVRPDYYEAHNNLANALLEKGDKQEAAKSLRRALDLNPRRYQLYWNLANTLLAVAELPQALDVMHKAVERFPDSAFAYNDMGLMCLANEKNDDAAAAFRQALSIHPDFYPAQNNLGHTLQIQGRIAEAIACYERAMELEPNTAAVASNRLYALHLVPEIDPALLLREHRAWDEKFARPLKEQIKPHTNDRSPERRLKIGYVSTDFRNHVAGWGALSLMTGHDHSQFEIYCYCGVERPDGVTELIRARASVWRNVATWSDERVAELVRQDEIDILVDLSLHSAGNRLLAFARKPAPIQLTYLGYAGTTGMETMDYRFSDPQLDPPDADTSCYSETTVRLPDCYWCYQPAGPTAAPSELPAEKNGYVTFGCLSNFSKVSAPVLKLWQRLMQQAPEARLLLYCPAMPKRKALVEEFSAAGIEASRLDFVDRVPFERYMENYHRIDITLDPFPYGGAITTCDSLWMGVPVVTLAGRTAVGRAGVSVLTTAGLPDLVARSEDEYIAIAAKLAGDRQRLAELRRTLRERLEKSPLTDKKRFARNVEEAYRRMWRQWTEENPAGNQSNRE
jgi:predicted O-linked N-acetylglucosamine transferase (SPINDLY family)